MQESYRLVLNIRSLLCEPRGIPSAMAMQIACSIDFFGGSGKKKKKRTKEKRTERERERGKQPREELAPVPGIFQGGEKSQLRNKNRNCRMIFPGDLASNLNARTIIPYKFLFKDSGRLFIES